MLMCDTSVPAGTEKKRKKSYAQVFQVSNLGV